MLQHAHDAQQRALRDAEPPPPVVGPMLHAKLLAGRGRNALSAGTRDNVHSYASDWTAETDNASDLVPAFDAPGPGARAYPGPSVPVRESLARKQAFRDVVAFLCRPAHCTGFHAAPLEIHKAQSALGGHSPLKRRLLQQKMHCEGYCHGFGVSNKVAEEYGKALYAAPHRAYGSIGALIDIAAEHRHDDMVNMCWTARMNTADALNFAKLLRRLRPFWLAARTLQMAQRQRAARQRVQGLRDAHRTRQLEALRNAPELPPFVARPMTPPSLPAPGGPSHEQAVPPLTPSQFPAHYVPPPYSPAPAQLHAGTTPTPGAPPMPAYDIGEVL